MWRPNRLKRERGKKTEGKKGSKETETVIMKGVGGWRRTEMRRLVLRKG